MKVKENISWPLSYDISLSDLVKIIKVHLKLTVCYMLICCVKCLVISIALNAPSNPILIPILQMKKLSLKERANFPKADMMRRLSGEFVYSQ